MSETAGRTGWKDFMPAISLALVLIGAALTGGGKLNQIDEHSRRIAALEERLARQEDRLSDLQVRVSGVDAKIELRLDRDKEMRR